MLAVISTLNNTSSWVAISFVKNDKAVENTPGTTNYYIHTVLYFILNAPHKNTQFHTTV